ncbi:MAG: GrpB family protein [Clostridium butyricum]|nr:GrpB family protein [Clostridium butyricum]
MFRDYIRYHDVAVIECSKVKIDIARLYSEDVESYIEYKLLVIEKIY